RASSGVRSGQRLDPLRVLKYQLWSRSGGQLHVHAQVAKTLDESVGNTFLVALVEVCLAKILVDTAGAQDVENDDQNRMGNGDRSALAPASCCEAAELSSEIGVGLGGGMGGFDQRATQSRAAASGAPVEAFAAAFVVPGTQTCPGRQVCG